MSLPLAFVAAVAALAVAVLVGDRRGWPWRRRLITALQILPLALVAIYLVAVFAGDRLPPGWRLGAGSAGMHDCLLYE